MNGWVGEFNEDGVDSGRIKIRMLAIRAADEAMRNGVSDRDNRAAYSGR
jgi:hypothetical protein